MAQYFKKGSFGRMIETVASDREAIEVRLDPDEYKEMRQELDSRRAHIGGLAAQLNNIKRLLEQAQQQLWKAETENNRLNEEKKEVQVALVQQQALNAGLLRISRERANAARGLTPKKERSGYVVLSSTQAAEHVSKGQTAGVWRSVVQTPYDTALPLEAIQPQIEQELKETVYGRIGIAYVADRLENGKIDAVRYDREGRPIEGCALYRLSYRANYRERLWEMVWFTTKALTVPEDFRPAEKEKEIGAPACLFFTHIHHTHTPCVYTIFLEKRSIR